MAALEESGTWQVTVGAIAETIGRNEQDTWVGLRSLEQADYVTWTAEVRTMDGVRRLSEPRLAERGRVLLGQWPDDSYGALVAELEARIATTDDPVEKGRLRALLEGVVGVGREMAVDVLAKVITNGPP